MEIIVSIIGTSLLWSIPWFFGCTVYFMNKDYPAKHPYLTIALAPFGLSVVGILMLVTYMIWTM